MAIGSEDTPNRTNGHIKVDFSNTPKFNFRAIPQELRDTRQWVDWKLADGKKLPVNPHTGKMARVDDPATWGAWSRAVTHLQEGSCTGVGFVFTAHDYYVGIDLDHCRDPNTDVIEPWAQAIITEVDSYTEISQSGTGVHIIVIGWIDGGSRKGHVEAYKTGRYFAMTGNVLPGHRQIFSRDLRDFAKRLVQGTLEKKTDQTASGEDWHLIARLAETTGLTDPNELEAAFRRRYPRLAADRDAAKGQRNGKSYIRYTVEKSLKDKREIRIDFGRGHNAHRTTKSCIIEERLSEIEPQRCEWLWRPYIPAGRLTILAGDPGMGKSQVAIDLASRISRGAPMPVCEQRTLGHCAIATAEDHTAETIVPRIIASGGDRSKLQVIRKIMLERETRYLSFPRDVGALHDYLKEGGVRLLIVDPLNAFLGASTDTYRDHDVRLALSPLEEIAEVTGCAILIIAHLNKKEDASTLYRVGGSIGLIGAARSVLAVSESDIDENMRVLYSLKANLSRRPPALQYSIDYKPELDSTHVSWHGLSDFDPERKDDGPQKLKECYDFLKEALGNGEVPAATLWEDAAAAGLSTRTLKRYKLRLGVRATKRGDKWYWAPPEKWEEL